MNISKRFLLVVALVAASFSLSINPASARSGGYWMISKDGVVYAFGGAALFGNPFSTAVNNAVDIEATPSGNGYWILGVNGSVSEFGNAKGLGNGTNVLLEPGESFVSMSVTPDGGGYWLFTNKGRVLTYGNAPFYGSMSGVKLNGPILGSVATSTGHGYWMVASDGGIFSFGDAKFYGSMGGSKLNKPVMSMAPDPDGIGYWLVASDGGIFAFNANFYGSMGGTKLNKPISGMVPSPTGFGYLMVAEDGGIFAFGDVPFYGSLGGSTVWSPIVAVAAIGSSPDPIYQSQKITETMMGTSETSSAPFNLTADTAEIEWGCINVNGTYSYGCGFRVINYDTGEWLDAWMPDVDKTGIWVLHPTKAGRYYIQTNEFGDDTWWGYTVYQNRCVANCN